MYPGLSSLILANNSLSSIHEPEDALQRLFPNLHSINLHNSGLYESVYWTLTKDKWGSLRTRDVQIKRLQPDLIIH